MGQSHHGSFAEFLDVAHKLANASGASILPLFRSFGSADNKDSSAFDPVTKADRDAEQAMRAVLREHFPHHGIAGEEFEPVNEGADYVWHLDPIDGTRAFILGMPLWGTLIGLSYQGKPLLGVMDQPFCGERFWNDEKTTWYRGPRGGLVRCETRKCATLGEAFLTASSPDMFEGEDKAAFDALAAQVKFRRFGGDCYAYCMLALGQIDIVAESQLKSFDIAPLIPIIEKAGGEVHGWRENDPAQGGACFACGDPALAPSIKAAIARGNSPEAHA
jgi:myo-inositol-1(or 4)-monophosphatase